jgi:hypothetical protein
MLGRLGGYEISGVVGTGGMGVVLKASDPSLDRVVAIKVLAPHLASSGAARKRFAREARAAAAVLHPNVIAIHSVFTDDKGLPYLVMPYVRGMSLQRRLDREGPLSLHEVLRIGAQIAAGLAAAHAQGLVHRDIKPANILLEDGIERVTITDFGLARAVDDATITHSGMIAGTPQYMSPEQARGEAVDPRSDLFSLGSVLYAICTGRPPFRAETSYGVMRRITDDEPKPIRELNPDIPEWLCQIISKLMSKRAADRYESAAEVAELLEQCLAHVQQPAVARLPASLQPQAKRRFFSPSRRWSGAIAMIATVGFMLLGLFAWQATEAPDIAGNWSGDEWGEVVLKKTGDGQYSGTYSDTFGKGSGEIELKWSRLERRYYGAWSEGADRFGELTVRLVGEEIRGAHTTDAKSKINPATPRLADLSWKRAAAKHSPGAREDAAVKVAEANADAIQSAASKGLKFLAEYQHLRGLSLDMTETEFLAIVESLQLKVRKTTADGTRTYSIPTGDGHTVIVMFRKGSLKCTGIQRLRGEEYAEATADPASDAAKPDETRLWNAYGVTREPVSPLTAKVLEWSGLHLNPITKEEFRDKNVLAKYPGGLDVAFVRSNGPAEKAGVNEVDIVVKLQGRPLTSLEELDAAIKAAVEQIERGDADSLQWDVLREGETIRINIPFPVADAVDLSELSAATKQFNTDTAKARKELFTPPIPDLTVKQLREGFRQTADLSRRQGMVQIADALKIIP